MSVVTIAEAWPASGRPFTVAELDRMPDDGRRYELLDGVLIVSPRPTTIRQFVAMRLLRVLADACPEDLCVIPEPAVELGPAQRVRTGAGHKAATKLPGAHLRCRRTARTTVAQHAGDARPGTLRAIERDWSRCSGRDG